MGIRGWVRGRKGETERVQPSRPPSWEQLEPRLLLNADLIGTDALIPLLSTHQEQVICVDLAQEDPATIESQSSVFTIDLTAPGATDPELAVEMGMSPLEGDLGTDLLDATADLMEDSGPVEADLGAASAPAETPDAQVESAVEVALVLPSSSPIWENESTAPAITGQQDNVPVTESLPIEIRGPPDSASCSASILPNDNYTLEPESSNLTLLSSVPSSLGVNAPELPGLRLIDPDISNWQGQVIYLNFDGAKGVIYHGPVTVGSFDVPAFQAPGALAGQEQTVVAAVLAELERTFANSGIIFTIQKPEGPQPYSTIYIGGDGSVFRQYGSFLGLAEQVDVGNRCRADEAWVFVERMNGKSTGESAETIAGTISHEVGHLLGYRHESLSEDTSILAPLAASLGFQWVEIAGQRFTGTSGSVTVTTGQTFDITADFENRTSTNVGHGGITMSLPSFDGSADTYNWYSYEGDTNGSRGVTYKFPGETVYKRGGTATTATAFMIEGDDTTWTANNIVPPYDEDNILRLGVTASSTAETFYVYVRAWLSDSNWAEREVLPTSSSYTDQQSYPVYRYTVNVAAPDTQGPYAPGSVDINPDSTNDTGISQTDNITKNTNPQFQWTKPSDRGSSGTKDAYNWEVRNSSDGLVKSDSTSNTYVNPGALSDGDYTFRIQAQDNAGNWGDWGSCLFKIDATKPTLPSAPLLQPVGDTTVPTPTPFFDWKDASDNLSGIAQYELWVGSDTLGVTKLDKTGIGLSQYTPTAGEALSEERLKWSVRVQDNAGNWSEWTNSTYGYQYFTVRLPYVNSVRWEDASGNSLSGPVDEGSTAYLAVYATDFSTGQVFSADIIEGGVASQGEQVSNLAVSYVSSSKWRASWTTMWLKDTYDYLNGNYDPEYYFRLDTYGNTSSDLRVRDATPPGAASFDSGASSHQPNVWSCSNAPDIWWTEPADGSGIAGYSILINNSSAGTPGTTVDTTSRHYSWSNELDSSNLWVHVRAQDNSGNWATSANVAHFGPFKIDATKPTLPSAPLLQPVGDTTVPTPTPFFDWKDASDNLSGIAQYELWVGSDTLGVTKLDKTGIGLSQYTPTAGEALSEERLKWSVRVQDNAGNWSEWTNSTYGYQYFTVRNIPDITAFAVNQIDGDGDGFASKLGFVVTVNGGSVGLTNGSIKIMEDDWFFDDPIALLEPVTLAAGETRVLSKTVAVAEYPKLWGDGIETWWPYRATQFEFVAKLYDGSEQLDSAKVNKDTHNLEILDGEYTEHIQTLADFVKNNRFDEYFAQFGGKPVLTFGGKIGLKIDDLVDVGLGAAAGSAAGPGGTAIGAVAGIIKSFVSCGPESTAGLSLITQIDLYDLMGQSSDAGWADDNDLTDDWITIWQTGGIYTTAGVAGSIGLQIPFVDLEVVCGVETLKTGSLEEDPSIWNLYGTLATSAKEQLLYNQVGASVGINGEMTPDGVDMHVETEPLIGNVMEFDDENPFHVGTSTLTPAEFSIEVEEDRGMAITYEIRADIFFGIIDEVLYGLPKMMMYGPLGIPQYLTSPQGMSLAMLMAEAIQGQFAGDPFIRLPVQNKPEIDVEIGYQQDVHSYDFGQIASGASASQIFTIRNEGDTSLTVSQASGLSAPFSISPANGSGSGDDWLVQSGQTKQFTVTYSPTAENTYEDYLTLVSNDENEGDYQIRWIGTTTSLPEIEVRQYTTLIVDDSVYEFGFGSVQEGDGSIDVIFTINNLGGQALSVGTIYLDNNNGFAVTQQPATSLAAGGSTTFTISLLDTPTGSKSADVRFSNGDSNENLFNFRIVGQVIPLQNKPPTIGVLSDSRGIVKCCG